MENAESDPTDLRFDQEFIDLAKPLILKIMRFAPLISETESKVDASVLSSVEFAASPVT